MSYFVNTLDDVRSGAVKRWGEASKTNTACLVISQSLLSHWHRVSGGPWNVPSENDFEDLSKRSLQIIRERTQIIVVDEADLLQSGENHLSQLLLSIPTTRRIAITGFPLQNNILELCQLVRFVTHKNRKHAAYVQWLDKFMRVNMKQRGKTFVSDSDIRRLGQIMHRKGENVLKGVMSIKKKGIRGSCATHSGSRKAL